MTNIYLRAGDEVRIKATNETGTVLYAYYNGFVCVDTGAPIEGGVLNNNSTYKIGEVELASIDPNMRTKDIVEEPKGFWDELYTRANERRKTV